MDEARRTRCAAFAALRDAGTTCPGEFRGRGIVTCGSVEFLTYLWALVHSLRHQGCTLPIELWHMEGEVPASMSAIFTPLGVTTRDAGRLPWNESRPNHPRNAHGFKPYAIARSSFREVLFLDADNSVYRDPSFIFDSAEFREKGAIFWPDALDADFVRPGARELRQDFGVEPGGVEFESGQIAIDKSRHWHALELTIHLNEHNDYFYPWLHGDKETFRLAFDALGGSYAFVAEPARRVSRTGWTMIQSWFDGSPLFYHRAGEEKFFVFPRHAPSPPDPPLPGLPADVAAERFGELRRHWRHIAPLSLRLYQVYTAARARLRPLRLWYQERSRGLRRRSP